MLGHWLDSRFVFTVRLSGIAFVLYSTISQPLCRSTCVSWHHCLRTRTFCPSEGLLPLLLLRHPFNCLFSRTTWVSRHQKGKTSLDLNEARDDQLDHMKQSAPPCRQITTPTPQQFFTGRMLFLLLNQQCIFIALISLTHTPV